MTATGAAQSSTQPSTPAGRTHFIGIGGAGMSAIARILLAQGRSVSGSDAKDSAGLRELAALGAVTTVGHEAGAVTGAGTVVVSSAIRESNPELAAARRLGLRVLHRSQALAEAMGGDDVVAVAGTHGKTTTTAMIAVLLRGAGLDPSFAIGGTVPALGVNAASGASPIFVAEADESDGSFLNYRPRIAVVTNIEADHLDHYGTADAVFSAFDEFAALLPGDGLLIACADDAGSLALAGRARAAGRRVSLYGTAENAGIRLLPERTGTGMDSSGSVLMGTGTSQGRYQLRLAVPGLHNARNAAAALAVAQELGVDPDRALEALAGFSGAARRFEFKGEAAGVRVYDDYAHHPTEVQAALLAARSVAGTHRVHVLFQPHLYSRTRAFAAEFAAALELADSVAVLEIYPAREDPIEGVTSQLVTSGLDRGPGLVPDPVQAVELLAGAARPGDVVLTIGAGDVTDYGPALVTAIARRAATDAEPGADHGL